MTKSGQTQALLDAILRRDLGTFVGRVFHTVSPGDAYLHNWHIDALAYELMRVHRGESLRLVVNQPPRSLKSLVTSVAFVAWALGHDPAKRFACVSYSQELADTFSRQFRLVVGSAWYRRLFPRLGRTKDTETEYETSLGGGRFAVSVGGSFTGRGADIIIVDDPMKADEAQSEKARRNVNDWFASTLLSRLDDKARGAIIVVMQRLHEDDLAGKLLREGGWQHLDLPAVAEEEQTIRIGREAVHRRRKGDALHPARESFEVLEHLKREMGSLAFSAQYQQRPVPAEGNLVRREWIRSYEAAPHEPMGGQIVQSWDIATTTGETNDWSVCTTWLVRGTNYYLLHLWRDRLEFPALRRRLVELARAHRPNTILIEMVGPGQHLFQELRHNPAAGVPAPIGIRPEGDKLSRMAAQSTRFEAGQVYLPREAPWLATFLEEILAFPNGRYDDQVDSVSQFLNWIQSRQFALTLSVAGPIICGDAHWPDDIL